MGKRLFAIDVLAHPERRHRHHGMQMVGGGHQDRIDALFLFEHHAKIGIAFRTRVFGKRVGRVVGIDIAKGDDVLARQRSKVCSALSANPDCSNVQPAVGTLRSGSAYDPARKNHDCRGRSSLFQKRATAEAALFGC
jgi:hypothetical protein